MRRLFGLAGSLLAACVGGTPSVPQPAACPDSRIDTASWKEGQSFQVGARLLMPPGYEQVIMNQRIGDPPPSAHFWNMPTGTITLYRVPADSVMQRSPTRTPRTMRCALPTGSGDAEAYLKEEIVPRGGTKVGPQFTIGAHIVRGDGRTAVLFFATSHDSAAFKQQLVSARTLALRGPNR